MAEKRKVKRRKDEDFDFDGKKAIKPSKDEIAIAKWLKKNVPVKKTKFAGHNVEYFTGSKAVDALLESKWSRKKGEKEAFFNTRQDIVHFLNNMLRHKFFHRAKKVPVSEQELKAKMKKKDKKPNDKDDKKRKEEETAESSHAEGKDAEDKTKHGSEDRQKKCKKIKLEMHFEQMFVDNLDAYVWIYDPIPFYYWVIGALVVLGAILICLFPLWPPTVRMGVQYLSMAAAGLLILILALAVIRLIIFCIVWLLTCGTLHLWLLPNLTEDVGFFASFWPLYEYKYGKDVHSSKDKKRKKKAKDSDNEEEPEKNSKNKQKKYKDQSDNEEREPGYEHIPSSEPDANDDDEQDDDENQQENDTDDDTQDDTEDDIDVDSDDDNSEAYDPNSKQNSPSKSPKKSAKNDADKKSKSRSKSKEKASISRNDSEETDTESSSQHSQTGKDFEIIDKEDSDVKS